tara:strand:+ start:242 stop:430 length:189 start_codon:yes stop_codon:yes gene_type:complete
MLPLRPLEASTAATLLSFLVFALLVLAAFSVRSILKLSIWMTGAGLVLGGMLWVSIAAGGRV